MATTIDRILDRAVGGERLSVDEGLALLQSHDLAALGRAADAVTRRLHPEPFRTYNVDRNINYTNVCTSGCRFCAFSRRCGDADAYVISRDELHRKIEETDRPGRQPDSLAGRHAPRVENRVVRGTAPRHQAGLSRRSTSTASVRRRSITSLRFRGCRLSDVLERLKRAGLGSLPGGGAEILVDRVRRQVSPCKTSADRWLEICRAWHALGGRGSATMMFGHVETLADRIEHLERLRRLQDETHGFTAFICWTFQPGNTALAGVPKAGAFEYLKTLAVSRLFLDNFANLQASWVTQGLAVGQLALRFGANDFGSVMIEENVVAAAGTSFRATKPKSAGRILTPATPLARGMCSTNR